MKSRHSVAVVEAFYEDPESVRGYALRQSYYTPYEDEAAVRIGQVPASWWATRFKLFDECPFKSSKLLVEALEESVGEKIDMAHWKASYPVDAHSKPLVQHAKSGCSCLWNCSFHVKPANGQQLGQGVHNHVTDSWNSIGSNGWAGIIYLSPDAPPQGGLHLWRNIDAAKQFDWMTAAGNWELIDSFGNVFNRLILVRGDIPHSGAAGWGNQLENGRMYQTFFFRTISRRSVWPVAVIGVQG